MVDPAGGGFLEFLVRVHGGVRECAGAAERRIVKNSGASPTLRRPATVEVRYEMPASRSSREPRVVHLFPKQDGWVLMGLDKGEVGQHFPDLGRALDAASSGFSPVHIIVHEREAASQAYAG